MPHLLCIHKVTLFASGIIWLGKMNIFTSLVACLSANYYKDAVRKNLKLLSVGFTSSSLSPPIWNGWVLCDDHISICNLHGGTLILSCAKFAWWSSPGEVRLRGHVVNLLAGSPDIWRVHPIYRANLIHHLSKSELKPKNIVFRWNTEILYCRVMLWCMCGIANFY